MIAKHIIITVLVSWLAIIVVAFGIAAYRHDVGIKSMLEYSWGVSAAVTAIGFFARGGAVTGSDVLRSEGVRDSSLNPEGYLEAESKDLVTGVAFGTIVMLAGLAVFITSLAFLYAFFRQ
jgi:hypothetical protein